jgi:hypothetical protein
MGSPGSAQAKPRTPVRQQAVVPTQCAWIFNTRRLLPAPHPPWYTCSTTWSASARRCFHATTRYVPAPCLCAKIEAGCAARPPAGRLRGRWCGCVLSLPVPGLQGPTPPSWRGRHRGPTARPAARCMFSELRCGPQHRDTIAFVLDIASGFCARCRSEVAADPQDRCATCHCDRQPWVRHDEPACDTADCPHPPCPLSFPNHAAFAALQFLELFKVRPGFSICGASLMPALRASSALPAPPSAEFPVSRSSRC